MSTTRDQAKPPTRIPGAGAETSSSVVALKPYPIGTAARLAGIPPETLRIWERRFKMLAPVRTEGGHRLYSQADVELLRAVKRLLDAGMRIGAVAAMPHDQILRQAEVLGASGGAKAEHPLAHAAALIEEILVAARGMDSTVLAALLDRPRMLADPTEVATQVYLPLLARVGDLWHAGELPIAVEHLVEKLVTARLHALLQSSAQARSGRLAMLACPPHERHEAGLLAGALALKQAGFQVAFLGADLPTAELVRAAGTLAPSFVLLACTSPLAGDVLAELAAALQAPPLAGVPLLLGGAAAPALQQLLTRPSQWVRQVQDLPALAAQLAR